MSTSKSPRKSLGEHNLNNFLPPHDPLSNITLPITSKELVSHASTAFQIDIIDKVLSPNRLARRTAVRSMHVLIVKLTVETAQVHPEADADDGRRGDDGPFELDGQVQPYRYIRAGRQASRQLCTQCACQVSLHVVGPGTMSNDT